MELLNLSGFIFFALMDFFKPLEKQDTQANFNSEHFELRFYRGFLFMKEREDRSGQRDSSPSKYSPSLRCLMIWTFLSEYQLGEKTSLKYQKALP